MAIDFDDNYEDDDKEAEGYECQHCGYVPTYRELNRGSCPGCAEARKIRKAADHSKVEEG